MLASGLPHEVPIASNRAEYSARFSNVPSQIFQPWGTLEANPAKETTVPTGTPPLLAFEVPVTVRLPLIATLPSNFPASPLLESGCSAGLS